MYVNICENVSELNKEARWTECGCYGGYENCVHYFSRNTLRKASFRRRRHVSMCNSEVALKSVVWGIQSSVQEYDPVMCIWERVTGEFKAWSFNSRSLNVSRGDTKAQFYFYFFLPSFLFQCFGHVWSDRWKLFQNGSRSIPRTSKRDSLYFHSFILCSVKLLCSVVERCTCSCYDAMQVSVTWAFTFRSDADYQGNGR